MDKPKPPFSPDTAHDLWSWFMIVLSVLFLVGYSAIILAEPEIGAAVPFIMLGMLIIWVIFIIEYAVAFAKSRQGFSFVYKHWLYTLSIILPIVRPFLLIRYINQLEYFRRKSAGAVRARIIISAVSFAAMFIYVIALTEFRLERYAPGANITSFGDAIWWAFVTIATVGYGDYYPVTVSGRFFAVVLMLGGIGIVGTASALVVSYLNEHTQRAIRAHEENS